MGFFFVVHQLALPLLAHAAFTLSPSTQFVSHLKCTSPRNERSAYHRGLRASLAVKDPSPFGRVRRRPLSSACPPSLRDAIIEPGDGPVPDLSLLSSESAPSSVLTELWLDLRGTAIAPHAALSHLTDDLWREFTIPSGRRRIVDKILVSEDGVRRTLQCMSSQGDGDDHPKVLFQSQVDGSIRCAIDDSVVYGKTFAMQSEGMTDPIPALDVVSRGGWAVVDTEKIKDDAKRAEAINGIVEFLSAGSSGSSLFLDLGGGLLGMDDYEGQIESVTYFGEGSTAGGLAVSCLTKSEIVKAGAMFQALQSGSAFVTTESGILLQQNEDTASGSILEAGKMASGSLKSALVLPFEALLWKTAALVFGDYSV